MEEKKPNNIFEQILYGTLAVNNNIIAVNENINCLMQSINALNEKINVAPILTGAETEGISENKEEGEHLASLPVKHNYYG